MKIVKNIKLMPRMACTTESPFYPLLDRADVIFLKIWKPIKICKIIFMSLRNKFLGFSTKNLSSNEHEDKV
jgi:hypothetical protein